MYIYIYIERERESNKIRNKETEATIATILDVKVIFTLPNLFVVLGKYKSITALGNILIHVLTHRANLHGHIIDLKR